MRIEARNIRRLNAISVIGLGLTLVLIYRLVSLQVMAADGYAVLARNQQEERTLIHANRGRILDRNGKILSTNVESQSFFANNVSDSKHLRDIARSFVRDSGESGPATFERLNSKRSFVWLARKVVDGPAIDQLPEGVGCVIEMRRKYPMGNVAGQLLGHTSIDNAGLEGLELAFDPLLRGKPGETVLRVDARGKNLSALGAVRRTAEDGGDLVLTIDLDFQCIVEEELKSAVKRFRARSGIAIVTNPLTGEILALANVPLYDPNHYSRYDPALRRNRAVTDIYEPGSTFKIVAIAGALNEGKIGPEEKIFCENGVLDVRGGKIRDHRPHGWLSVAEILEVSSNIGTAKVARRLGPAGLNRYVRLFGYGTRTGSDLVGEVAGEAKHPSLWSKRSLETIAIGQEIGVTALQMAAAYGAIANEGRLMAPRIMLRAQTSGSTLFSGAPEVVRQVISTRAARLITTFLEGTVLRGTGSQAQVPGYRVAGKTGTAQRALENEAGYDPDQFVSSFIGFMPADRPELLCVVIVDSPKEIHWGSQVAAPVFSRIMRRILGLRNTGLRHRAASLGSSPDLGVKRLRPEVAGLTRKTASRILARYGIESRALGRGNRVVAQRIGHGLDSQEALVYLGSPGPFQSDRAVHTPDVTDIPLRQAIYQLTSAGLRVKVSGSGWVVRQAPRAGTSVSLGSFCEVTCGRREG